MARTETYRGIYAAKFAREAKAKPSEWTILATRDCVELHHVAAPESDDTDRRRILK